MLGKISKLKLRDEPYRITRQLTPATYQLEHPETGQLKPRPVHISQIARLRVPSTADVLDSEDTALPGGASLAGQRDVTLIEGGVWEKVRVPGYAVFRFKVDEVTWLRVAEVLALTLENGTAELWSICGLGSTRSRSGMSHLPCLLTIQNISTSEIEGCLMSSPKRRGCRIYSGEEARYVSLTLSSWCPTS